MAATPLSVQHAHTYAASTAQAYRAALAAPLPEVFSRRHLLLPPITEVRDQQGEWGSGGVGQTRTIVTADRGTLREELTVLEEGERFGYTLTRITGPMKPLVSYVEGMWTVAPAGAGSTITWAWTIHPRSVLTTPGVRLIRRFWPGYAAKALAQLDRLVSP